MRTLRWAIATTASLVLVSTMASGALGQSPSPDPPPWFGGRVEMPEHGFALTVPDGWVALDPAGDVSAQFDVVLARWGNDHYVFPPVIAPPQYKLQLDAGPSLTPPIQHCKVWSWSSPSHVADRIDGWRKEAAAGDGFVLDVRTIETPHTTATVVDRVFSGQEAEYYFERPDEVLMLYCQGNFRADDDWLFIAETFEFLPAE